MPPVQQRAEWRRAVEPYVGPDSRRASFQVATTLGLLVFAWFVLITLLRHPSPVAPWIAFVLAFPTAGLLIRTFILMHDCAHGSLFSSVGSPGTELEFAL